MNRSCPKKERRGLKAFSAMILSILQREKVMDYRRVAEVIIGMAGNEAEDKNIRRRIYDALNVMCAVDIVRKEKKLVYLTDTSICNCSNEIEERLYHLGRVVSSSNRQKDKVQEKKEQLEETQRRRDLLVSLIKRNRGREHLDEREKLHFPFLLISTGKAAKVDCETNDKRSYFQFRFNSEYTVHEDVHVLKQIFADELPRVWTAPAEKDEKPSVASPGYLFTEEDDWLNIYNFLN